MKEKGEDEEEERGGGGKEEGGKVKEETERKKGGDKKNSQAGFDPGTFYMGGHHLRLVVPRTNIANLYLSVASLTVLTQPTSVHQRIPHSTKAQPLNVAKTRSAESLECIVSQS